MSDKLLLNSLKNDDRNAMDSLFNTYWEFVFDAAFRKLGDEDVASDITQELFISIWENRATLKVDTSLHAYLYGAVKFRVINHFRTQTMRDGHQAELSYLMEQQYVDPTDAKLMVNDLEDAVEEALSRLPERMRLVVRMSRLQDRSVKEIAEELGVSIQTVKNQITAGMKILKKELSYTVLLAFLLS